MQQQIEVMKSYETSREFYLEYRRLSVEHSYESELVKIAAKSRDLAELKTRVAARDAIMEQLDDMAMDFCKRILELEERSFCDVGGFTVCANGRFVQLVMMSVGEEWR